MALGYLRKLALGLGQRLLGTTAKSSETVLSGAARKIEKAKIAEWRAANPSATDVPRDILESIKESSQELAKEIAPNTLSKVAKYGTIAGTVGAGEYIARGNDGFVGGLANQTWTNLGQIEATQNSTGWWTAILVKLQEVLKSFNIEWGALDRAIENAGQRDSDAHALGRAISDNATGIATVGGAAATLTVGGLAARAYMNRNGTPTTPPSNNGGGGMGLQQNQPSLTRGVLTTATDAGRRGLGVVRNLGGAIFKRLPFVGAAATVASTAYMTSEASAASENFQAAVDRGASEEELAVHRDVVDTQEANLGGELIAGAAGSAAGLGAAFLMASNPVGWGVAAGVAVGVGAKFAADAIQVGDQSLSQWTGNKLTSAYSSVASWLRSDDEPSQAIAMQPINPIGGPMAAFQ